MTISVLNNVSVELGRCLCVWVLDSEELWPSSEVCDLVDVANVVLALPGGVTIDSLGDADAPRVLI